MSKAVQSRRFRLRPKKFSSCKVNVTSNDLTTETFIMIVIIYFATISVHESLLKRTVFDINSGLVKICAIFVSPMPP